MSSETFIVPRVRTDAIDGCHACAAKIAETLSRTRGFLSATPNQSPVSVVYSVDPAVLDANTARQIVSTTADSVARELGHERMLIGGMDCPDCARTIERGVSSIAGVQAAEVNLMAGQLSVCYDPRRVDQAAIDRRVSELGYHVKPQADQAGRPDERSEVRVLLLKRENLLALIAASLTLLGIICWFIDAPWPVMEAVYLTAILIGGLPIVRKGILTLFRSHSLDINFLMGIAVVGAIFLGEWLEAAAIVVLFAASEALEGYAMDRVRRSIRGLMDRAPTVALVRRGTVEVELPVGEVTPGDEIVVRPGQALPLDGIVIDGQSDVNQAPVTGESIPVSKTTGDEVFQGTVNGVGVLTVRVTRPADDSTVARIVNLVEAAQARRAPVQQLVDRFARVYTPAVVGLAIALAVIPYALGVDFATWFYRALVLLVIACPCALVLATPVSIVSAIAGAAKNGVLVKGGVYLERLAQVKIVAFDKTGTLTLGQPEVVSIVSLGRLPESEALGRAAALERHSEHPLGRAVVRAAEGQGLSLPPSSEVTALPGAGLTGVVSGHQYRAGSARLFGQAARIPAVQEATRRIESDGGTAVLFGDEAGVIAVFGLRDQPRPEARAALEALRQAGVRRLVMLSGDQPLAAETVGRELGVDDVRAGLLPNQKLALVEELRASGGAVAMVGDGINDAPALAASDVGIAMGVAGTGTAIETADIALMGDDLNGIARAIRLGRRAKRVIAVNIGVALAIKGLFLGLAAFGYATLWMAILADVGASLLVIGNGLRLYAQRPRDDGTSPDEL
jgi:Cd2+/Zn2+-exporting ATPase